MNDKAALSLQTQDKIHVLMVEYSALRTETIHRYNNVYQLLAVGAVLFVWLLSHPNGMGFWVGLGSSSAVLAVLSWSLRLDISNAAKRVREIEAEVNDLAGEALLVWESLWGGDVRGFFGRRKPALRPRTYVQGTATGRSEAGSATTRRDQDLR